MNVYKAYAFEITVEGSPAQGGYKVIDAAQSVGKKYPVVIGWVDVKYGFLHYQGYKGTTHEGVTAVFKGTIAEGPNHRETIERVLEEGLLNGRDDRI